MSCSFTWGHVEAEGMWLFHMGRRWFQVSGAVEATPLSRATSFFSHSGMLWDRFAWACHYCSLGDCLLVSGSGLTDELPQPLLIHVLLIGLNKWTREQKKAEGAAGKLINFIDHAAPTLLSLFLLVQGLVLIAAHIWERKLCVVFFCDGWWTSPLGWGRSFLLGFKILDSRESHSELIWASYYTIFLYQGESTGFA